MSTRQVLGVALVLSALGLAGCFSHSRLPSYESSTFKMIIARETWSRGEGGQLTEKDVQAEVDRLLALRPSSPVPKKVLLFEVESGGATRVRSARKELLLHKETAAAMKRALENTGLFAQIDFLPEIYLPQGAASLKTLRIAAARAHADGLLIYATEAGYEYEPNALCVFYPTIIGAFLAPGSRGSALAVSKAVLLDVKTGYIYRVMEAYGEKSAVAPVALLDEELLEFDARKQALGALAELAARKVKELGKAVAAP